MTDSKVDALLAGAGLEVSQGLAVTGGDRAAYLDLLDRFLEHHCGDGARIAQAPPGDGPGQAVRLAHSLKGISGNLGAAAVQALALEVEMGLRRGQAVDLPILGERIDDTLDRIAGAVDEAFAALPPAPATPRGDDSLFERASELQALTRLVAAQDVEALELAQALQGQLGGPAGTLMAEIARTLRQFDFDSARDTLMNLSRDHGIDLWSATNPGEQAE